MIQSILDYFEKQSFGVFKWWGDKLGIRASRIRLFFIYAAFADAITIFIYLTMTFILRLRLMIKFRKRKSVFDL